MLLKKSQRLVPSALLLALLVSSLSSCAGQGTENGLPSFPESEAALLDDAEAATPVAEGSTSVFADLAPATDPVEEPNKDSVVNDAFATLESSGPSDSVASETKEPADPTPTFSASSDSSEAFYSAIGGEKLGHVAYILYGSRAKAKLLSEENSGLVASTKLESAQHVNFSFDRLRPQAKFLTKDLIDRYPAQLAEKLERATHKEAKVKATVNQGETLQAVSQRLYGTTRYWTEIYLLNQAAIGNYDKVKAGTELTVIQRDLASAPAKATPAPSPKPAAKIEAPAPAAEPTPAPVVQAPAPVVAPPIAAPVVAPVAAPVVEPVVAPLAPLPSADPIPDTAAVPSSSFESKAFPAAATAATVENANGPTMSVKEFFANGANVRRFIYVLAILAIGIAAFFLTRSKKKSFDMLDMTTSDTAPRPKFGREKDDKKLG